MLLYIGPGLGGGVVAIITGIFLTILSFFVAVFWLPIKRFFKYIRGKRKKE